MTQTWPRDSCAADFEPLKLWSNTKIRAAVISTPLCIFNKTLTAQVDCFVSHSQQSVAQSQNDSKCFTVQTCIYVKWMLSNLIHEADVPSVTHSFVSVPSHWSVRRIRTFRLCLFRLRELVSLGILLRNSFITTRYFPVFANLNTVEEYSLWHQLYVTATACLQFASFIFICLD